MEAILNGKGPHPGEANIVFLSLPVVKIGSVERFVSPSSQEIVASDKRWRQRSNIDGMLQFFFMNLPILVVQCCTSNTIMICKFNVFSVSLSSFHK